MIMAVLMKYCWGFSTVNNKEHDKKLTTTDHRHKPRRKRQRKDLFGTDNLISDDRLRTKTTL